MSAPGRSVGSANETDLTERIAAVDKQAAIRGQSRGDPLQGQLAGTRMAAVERTDTHGDCEVVRRLARLELEVFGRNLADAQAAGGDLLGRSCPGLGDRLWGGRNTSFACWPQGWESRSLSRFPTSPSVSEWRRPLT